MISTVITILCTAAAAAFAWLAWKASGDAVAARDELQSGIRRLTATREELLVLEKRLDRVAGRVYAQGRRPRPIDDDGIEMPQQNGELDSDFAAELALQAAPVVAPGKRGA